MPTSSATETPDMRMPVTVPPSVRLLAVSWRRLELSSDTPALPTSSLTPSSPPPLTSTVMSAVPAVTGLAIAMSLPVIAIGWLLDDKTFPAKKLKSPSPLLS
eukprot:1234149-Rhodomonas_salina.2